MYANKPFVMVLWPNKLLDHMIQLKAERAVFCWFVLVLNNKVSIYLAEGSGKT